MRVGVDETWQDQAVAGASRAQNHQAQRRRVQSQVKLHRGKLPLLRDKQWLIPLAVEEFFADGDVDKAVRHAAAAVYDLGQWAEA